MEEIWKDIEEEGLNGFQISNYGRVKRLPYIKEAYITRGDKKILMKSQMKEKIIAPIYSSRNPSLRILTDTGKRINKSLGLLVLKYFGPELNDDREYVCLFKDGDITNLHIDNLAYVLKSDVGSIYGKLGNEGTSKENMLKYKNLLFKFNNIPLAFFHSIPEAISELNEQGFKTDTPSLFRHLQGKTPKYFYIFDVEEVEDDKVDEIINNLYPTNLKVLYDCIMLDRGNSRRFRSETSKVLNNKPKVVKEKKKEIKKEEIKKEIKPSITKIDFMSKLQAAMDIAKEKGE